MGFVTEISMNFVTEITTKAPDAFRRDGSKVAHPRER